MGSCKRTLLLTVVTISFLMLQNAALVSAAAPGYTNYTVFGYVKDTAGNAISGAAVNIYDTLDKEVYFGSTSTDGNGYFTKTISLRYAPDGFYCVVTKSGYQDNAAYGTRSGTSINMGTIPMNPLPPPAPDINSYVVTVGGLRQLTVSWIVLWGARSTSCTCKCYWSYDPSFDETEVIYTYASSSLQKSHSVSVPQNTLSICAHTYSYRILAQSKNGGGDSPSTTVEKTFTLTAWRIAPMGDAWTYASDPNSNFNGNTIRVVAGYPALPGYGWLKFNVPYPELVKSATLYAYVNSLESNGHGSIKAYESGTNWNENTITYANSWNTVSIGQMMAVDSEGSAGAWDSWNVLPAATKNQFISFRLTAVPPVGGYWYGATYYSKEWSVLGSRPYLEVEYWGVAEEAWQPSGFMSDTFDAPTLSPVWSVQSDPGNPWSYRLGDWGDCGQRALIVSGTGAITQQLGYCFSQNNLQVTGPFFFETWVEILAVEGRIGISLYSGGTPYAEVYFRWGWGEGFISGSSIRGNQPVETATYDYQGDGYQHLYIMRDCKGLVSAGILKDPYTNPDNLPTDITIATNRRELRSYATPSTETPSTITSVKIQMVAKQYFGTGSLACLEIRSDSWLGLENPRRYSDPIQGGPTYACFESPLQCSDFQSSNVTTYWKDIQGQTPVGTLYNWGPPFACSWHASSTGSREYTLMQQLVNDRISMTLDAIRGRIVSFKFSARYDAGPGAVRAVMRYHVVGQADPVAIAGPWVQLVQDEWVDASVDTSRPLPPTIDWLQVIMQGTAVGTSQTFSGYFDNTGFGIKEDNSLSLAATGGSLVSCGLAVVHAAYVPSLYEARLVTVLIIEAGSGTTLDRLWLDVKVSDGKGSIHCTAFDGSNQPNGVYLEGNNQLVQPYDPAPIVNALTTAALGAKWFTRLILFCTPDVPSPVGWIISDAVGLGFDGLISMEKQQAPNPDGAPNNPAQAHFIYQPNTQYAMIIFGLDWTQLLVPAGASDPMMQIDFTVQLCSATHVGGWWRNSVTMFLTMNTPV